MTDRDIGSTKTYTHLWEALCALHVAFWGLSTGLFGESEAIDVTLARMEIRINHFLHIRQTDLIRGYFSMWIPTLVIALLIFGMLRSSSRTRVTREFLRTVAGLITIVAPFAYWVHYWIVTSWPDDWMQNGRPFEMVTALIFAGLLLSRKIEPYFWQVVLLLAAHYTYWYYATEWIPFATNYASPVGPFLSFCAAVAWVRYLDESAAIHSLRRAAL